jgi:hypothetical protein
VSNGTAAAFEEYDLVEAIQRNSWLKLPLAVMQDVGPAVQTLGGVLKITNKETFATGAKIASNANVPLWTCRKHLATLHDHDWLINAGRQHTRRGAPRRTYTTTVPTQTRVALSPYGMLPWWAA